MIALTEGQPLPGFAELVRDAFSNQGALAKSRESRFMVCSLSACVPLVSTMAKS